MRPVDPRHRAARGSGPSPTSPQRGAHVITDQQISSVIGSTAVGPDGKHGTVGEVYLDDETGRPEWATVRTGLFGTKEAFVPLADATAPRGAPGGPNPRGTG